MNSKFLLEQLKYTVKKDSGISGFHGIFEDNATLSILKIMYRMLCKTGEVNPVKLNFSMTNKCFDTTLIYK